MCVCSLRQRNGPPPALLHCVGPGAQVRGLYLVGASTRPGNGVPLVMISGDLAAARVLRDARSSEL